MLNTRPVMDPRWAYFARGVVRGTMWANITIARPSTDDSWDPFDDDDPEFHSGFTYTDVFKGQARIQPNNDWRARQYRKTGELLAEHAVRIQVDLTGNELDPVPFPLPDDPNATSPLAGDAGVIQADDVLKVNSIESPYGHPVDAMTEEFTMVIRVISASSNSWVRTLLADYTTQHVKD